MIEALKLEGVFLLGWSMGGPTVLSYWKQFGQKCGHLAALGLIDMTPYPFHPGEWNSHGLKNFNAEGLNAFAAGFTYNHEAFVNGFVKKMFVDGTLPVELNWIVPECMKLLPHIGVALYGDYCYSDYTDVLPAITVPKASPRGSGSPRSARTERTCRSTKVATCCSGWRPRSSTRPSRSSSILSNSSA